MDQGEESVLSGTGETSLLGFQLPGSGNWCGSPSIWNLEHARYKVDIWPMLAEGMNRLP